MKRFVVTLALLAAMLLTATTAFAQTGDGTAGGTVPPAEKAPDAFITMNLEAGFVLDPFLVSVNGGGDVDASTLADGCTGYISENPILTVDWSGETDFVDVFFYSEHDPVLVIQTPDGGYLCNDDASDALLDPQIKLEAPAPGRYNFWVGSYDEGQLIPGILVLTARPNVTAGSFDLGDLVHRGAISEDDVQETEQTKLDELAKIQAETEITAPEEGTDTLSADVVADGEIPAFDIRVDDQICNGYISQEPAFGFNEDGNADLLRVFVEADADATLFLARGTDDIWCNDDAEPGVNLNPMVEIENPEAGDYFVYVGRLSLDEPITATVTATENAELMPAVLAPAASE
jgi:hypothetical protein